MFFILVLPSVNGKTEVARVTSRSLQRSGLKLDSKFATTSQMAVDTVYIPYHGYSSWQSP